MRIELAGSIAAGKTTLCNSLKKQGWNVISENLAENPYKDKTYPEGSLRGYYVQMAFLLSKASEIERQAGAGKTVCDYAMVTEQAYTRMHLGRDPEMCSQVMDNIALLQRRLGPPDLVIYLKSSPEAQFRRIQERMKAEGGRDFEKSLTVSYLTALNEEVEACVQDFERAGGKVLRVDTEKINLKEDVQFEILLSVIDEITAPEKNTGKPPQGPRYG